MVRRVGVLCALFRSFRRCLLLLPKKSGDFRESKVMAQAVSHSMLIDFEEVRISLAHDQVAAINQFPARVRDMSTGSTFFLGSLQSICELLRRGCCKSKRDDTCRFLDVVTTALAR